MPDLLFDTITAWHGSAPWGKLLDAGTGAQSLKWAMQLDTVSITAITADIGMMNSMERDVGKLTRPDDCVLVGNWMDPTFVSQLGKYDTILADYLIGAVDGFR
jgi:precorrin-6B methylase 2